MTFEMICSILLDHKPRIVSGEASDLDTRFVDTSKKAALVHASAAPRRFAQLLRTAWCS